MTRRALPLLVLFPLLGGCQAIPDIVGAAAAIGSGTFTGNPAVGVAIGLATATATDAVVKYYGRSRQHATQQLIARVGGELEPGGRAVWRTDHTIPLGNEGGEVRLVRDIPNPLAPCREIAFSVVDGDAPDAARQWFAAQICRDQTGWAWAGAEPAVARWGSLH